MHLQCLHPQNQAETRTLLAYVMQHALLEHGSTTARLHRNRATCNTAYTGAMLVGQRMVIPANSTVGDVLAPNTPLANLLAPTGNTPTDNAVAKAMF